MKKIAIILTLLCFMAPFPVLASEGCVPEKVLTTAILGNLEAPIKMVDYFSYSCSHCVSFYRDILRPLYEKYVQNGQLSIEFRDIPFDNKGVVASTIAHCLPKDQYMNYMGRILLAQAEIFQGDYETNLKNIGLERGLSKQALDACLANSCLKKGLVDRKNTALVVDQITRVPFHIISSQTASFRIERNKTQKEFENAVDYLLAGKAGTRPPESQELGKKK